LHEQPAIWEVLFICDGCTDGSGERLRELTRNEPERVRVVSYSPNRGKGYAVRHGLGAARGALRIFTDIDLAYTWQDVLNVASTLQQGADLVIASREHADSRITFPPSLQGYVYRRHIQSRLFVWLAHRLLPITQRDPQAGLKGMTARVVDQVLPHLHSTGFCLDCELLTACVRFGIPVVEVPCCVRYQEGASTTSLRSVGGMIRELWQIRKRWLRAPAVTATVPVLDTREAA
jgi:dolichyl-phosphate beta-glucosyltransferase